jgi:hypothetical protein
MECYSARPSRSSASGEVVSETLITARRSFRLGGTKGRTGENGCERFSATLAWAYRCRPRASQSEPTAPRSRSIPTAT